MNINSTCFMVALLASLLTACQSPQQTAAVEAGILAPGTKCSSVAASIDTEFPAGNIASCEFAKPNHVDIRIAPEDAPPINCSPWYAFRVQPKVTGEISLSLNYDACGHRYWPRISTDGKNWSIVPSTNMKLIYRIGQSDSEKGGIENSAKFSISLESGKAIFVSAQPIIAPATYDEWIGKLAQSDFVTTWELQKSKEGRSIPAMSIKAKGSCPSKQIVLIGRQHPPEITGAYGLFSFVEMLTSDDPLAQKFRAEYETIVVPILNPDGVVRGHWRHNTGGVDLNRDWGPFTQPETQAIGALLREIKNDPKRDLRFFVDFHSTWKDVFYTIPDEYPTDPAFFIRDWLAQLQTQMPEYRVNRNSNHEPGGPISKAYVYETYGIPAVTFELGDQTDPVLISDIAGEAAIAMIRTLLKTDLSSSKK
ncbi:MAG: M14-type cytosolic carboxypeptidase [Parasphingorhabdus sp.]|uniref:M14 family metallopeptidase n=1 Tax=Parasphingorhabdus sp. TaxID=2709688 RepID=UPI0030019097